MKTTRINNPDGSVMFSFDPSEEIDALTRKTVFDQYAEKVVYYQRFVKPSISEEMAKGILELCAAMIYNDNPSDEEMDEFAEKVADKRNLDFDELCDEFFEFSDYVHGD